MFDLRNLEKLVKDMSGPERELSKTEKIKLLVEKNLRKSREDLEKLKSDYKNSLREMERRNSNYECALKILNGREGFLRVSQEKDWIMSDFTLFEEAVEVIDDTFSDVFLEKPPVFFGKKLFKVERNGMLKLIEWKVDSSD